MSTSPMTLLIKDEGGEHEKASFVVLDPARRHIARVIPAGPQSGRPALDTVESGPDVDSHPYYRAVVGAGRLIAVSYPAGGELVAYDLSTGARVWSASQQDVKMISPVAVDGSTVIAAGSTRTGEATLVRVDLTSGKVLSSTPRPVGRGPLDVLIVYYHFTWDDGRAYAVDWRQSVNGSGFPELFTMAPPG